MVYVKRYIDKHLKEFVSDWHFYNDEILAFPSSYHHSKLKELITSAPKWKKKFDREMEKIKTAKKAILEGGSYSTSGTSGTIIGYLRRKFGEVSKSSGSFKATMDYFDTYTTRKTEQFETRLSEMEKYVEMESQLMKKLEKQMGEFRIFDHSGENLPKIKQQQPFYRLLEIPILLKRAFEYFTELYEVRKFLTVHSWFYCFINNPVNKFHLRIYSGIFDLHPYLRDLSSFKNHIKILTIKNRYRTDMEFRLKDCSFSKERIKFHDQSQSLRKFIGKDEEHLEEIYDYSGEHFRNFKTESIVHKCVKLRVLVINKNIFLKVDSSKLPEYKYLEKLEFRWSVDSYSSKLSYDIDKSLVEFVKKKCPNLIDYFHNAPKQTTDRGYFFGFTSSKNSNEDKDAYDAENSLELITYLLTNEKSKLTRLGISELAGSFETKLCDLFMSGKVKKLRHFKAVPTKRMKSDGLISRKGIFNYSVSLQSLNLIPLFVNDTKQPAWYEYREKIVGGGNVPLFDNNNTISELSLFHSRVEGGIKNIREFLGHLKRLRSLKYVFDFRITNDFTPVFKWLCRNLSKSGALDNGLEEIKFRCTEYSFHSMDMTQYISEILENSKKEHNLKKFIIQLKPERKLPCVPRDHMDDKRRKVRWNGFIYNEFVTGFDSFLESLESEKKYYPSLHTFHWEFIPKSVILRIKQILGRYLTSEERGIVEIINVQSNDGNGKRRKTQRK